MTKATAKAADVEPSIVKGEQRYFLLAVRSGLDAIESTVVSAAEIPLSVLAGMGVSDETTDAARTANKQLAHGIHGTVDSIVTQIADAVSKETALVADVVGQAAGRATPAK